MHMSADFKADFKHTRPCAHPTLSIPDLEHTPLAHMLTPPTHTYTRMHTNASPATCMRASLNLHGTLFGYAAGLVPNATLQVSTDIL